jgi:3-deoxy-D-arabino-heptulosonate 7-phosphate (DAHP) synthase
LPVTLTLVKERLALPVFVRVTASAGLVEFVASLANVSDAGVTVAAGAGVLTLVPETPVPESATCCGLAAALSVN